MKIPEQTLSGLFRNFFVSISAHSSQQKVVLGYNLQFSFLVKIRILESQEI